jgi:AraC family transcriptional regulator
MNIQPQIKTIAQIKLIGLSQDMSLIENKTFQLFNQFMIERKSLSPKNNLIFCVKEYNKTYFENFSPAASFNKWAAMELNNENDLPEKFKELIIPAGLYASFFHKGLNTDFRIYDYIFREWLPQSPYKLDYRPHFEILGEKYKNNDPNSEEEILIPIC